MSASKQSKRKSHAKSQSGLHARPISAYYTTCVMLLVQPVSRAGGSRMVVAVWASCGPDRRVQPNAGRPYTFHITHVRLRLGAHKQLRWGRPMRSASKSGNKTHTRNKQHGMTDGWRPGRKRGPRSAPSTSANSSEHHLSTVYLKPHSKLSSRFTSLVKSGHMDGQTVWCNKT